MINTNSLIPERIKPTPFFPSPEVPKLYREADRENKTNWDYYMARLERLEVAGAGVNTIQRAAI
jgi:hypothetical protein